MDSFRCLYVSKNADGKVQLDLTSRPMSELPEHGTLIRVERSSLNYKDALAATGNPGVAKSLPHVPGIDAAGTIVETDAPDLSVGQKVIVTGNELGAGQWGGWAEYIRVPADWVVPLPESMSLDESMMYGTAGFTAAQCVRELIRNEITPDKGQIIVTGSTGGVGCLAIKILAKLGYEITAVTGKPQAHTWLQELGASNFLSRTDVVDDGKKPLLSTRWAGAIDTVGGDTLNYLLRSTAVNGCVTACGLVGGAKLDMTVFPFILRGVRLAGITSAMCPRDVRFDIWNRLSGDWKLDNLRELTDVVSMEQMPEQVETILRAEIRGRILLNITSP